MARKQVDDLNEVKLQGQASQVKTFLRAPRTNTALELSEALKTGVNFMVDRNNKEKKENLQQAKFEASAAADNKMEGEYYFADNYATMLADYEAVKDSLRSPEQFAAWAEQNTQPPEDLTDVHQLAGYNERRERTLAQLTGRHAEYLTDQRIQTRSNNLSRKMWEIASGVGAGPEAAKLSGAARLEAFKKEAAATYGASPSDFNTKSLEVAEILVAQGDTAGARELLTHDRGPAKSLLMNPDTALDAARVMQGIYKAEADLIKRETAEAERRQQIHLAEQGLFQLSAGTDKEKRETMGGMVQSVQAYTLENGGTPEEAREAGLSLQAKNNVLAEGTKTLLENSVDILDLGAMFSEKDVREVPILQAAQDLKDIVEMRGGTIHSIDGLSDEAKHFWAGYYHLTDGVGKTPEEAVFQLKQRIDNPLTITQKSQVGEHVSASLNKVLRDEAKWFGFGMDRFNDGDTRNSSEVEDYIYKHAALSVETTGMDADLAVEHAIEAANENFTRINNVLVPTKGKIVPPDINALNATYQERLAINLKAQGIDLNTDTKNLVIKPLPGSKDVWMISDRETLLPVYASNGKMIQVTSDQLVEMRDTLEYEENREKDLKANIKRLQKMKGKLGSPSATFLTEEEIRKMPKALQKTQRMVNALSVTHGERKAYNHIQQLLKETRNELNDPTGAQANLVELQDTLADLKRRRADRARSIVKGGLWDTIDEDPFLVSTEIQVDKISKQIESLKETDKLMRSPLTVKDAERNLPAAKTRGLIQGPSEPRDDPAKDEEKNSAIEILDGA